MFFDDTIAAIATSSMNGGVSIIRVSGEDAILLSDRILSLRKPLNECNSHTVHYGFVVKDNEKIDEVLVLLMKGPNSYTREDVVEIQCHGGLFICQEILDLLIEAGVRMAEPGEFTKRAFLNGRIDLSQAEAVMDIIESKSKYALSSSIHQLSGIVKDKIIDIRSKILDDVAFIEAALDDPEHISIDEFNETFEEHLNVYISEIVKIENNYKNGRIIREGIQTVIVGRPNVGKSSFLNSMLGVDRAIVTNVPGTTRDILEEDARLGDVLLHLIDTAGIHETEDVVEQIGIQKAKKSLETADFCILILDSSMELTEEDIDLINNTNHLSRVILFNKNDKETKISMDEVSKLTEDKIISYSAKTGDGLDVLENYIKKIFYFDELSFNDEIYISNERQKQAISDCYRSLIQVKESVELQMGEDFYTIDLMNAYESLGKVIGESIEDDLVDTIFKKFCMGK